MKEVKKICIKNNLTLITKIIKPHWILMSKSIKTLVIDRRHHSHFPRSIFINFLLPLINQWWFFSSLLIITVAVLQNDIIISSSHFLAFCRMKMRNNSSQFISQQSLISTRKFLFHVVWLKLEFFFFMINSDRYAVAVLEEEE